MTDVNSEAAQAFRYTVLALQRQGNRHLGTLLRELELTPAQAETLEILGDHGPLTTRGVGDYMLCESGSPSRILAALSKKGLSVRSISSYDRRATLHALTVAGRKKLQEVRVVEDEFNSEFSALLSGQFGSSRELNDFTTKLVNIVGDQSLRGALNRRFPKFT